MLFTHTYQTVADILNQSSILNASLSSTPKGSSANVFGPYKTTPRMPSIEKHFHDEIKNGIHGAGAITTTSKEVT
jgi:hypothetical protein